MLGTKLGMTQVFDDNNRSFPVTVVQAGPCVVTQVRTPENDGYAAVQLGFGEIDPRKVNKPVGGHVRKAGVTPRRHLVELRTDDASEYTLGQEIAADMFASRASRRRHRHHQGQGLRRCHEAPRLPRPGRRRTVRSASTARRAPSAAARPPVACSRACKMAGRMGGERTTSEPDRARVDAERGLLLIKGAVPGPKGGLVLVRSAAKTALSRRRVR